MESMKDISKGVETQIVEKENKIDYNFKKENKIDYPEQCEEIREILNESINKEYLKYYFHTIEEEMLNLVIYEVKIMEYAYNYLTNNKEDYKTFISREVKEKDFKKLKELCYDSIELVGYFAMLNEKFREVLKKDGSLSHKDVDLYFKLFEILKSSAHLFNEKYENLHEFVKTNIEKNVCVKYKDLVELKKLDVIPKIDRFEEEFGKDYYERIFKIVDKNLCEKHLEKGKQRANKYLEKSLNFMD